MAVKPTSLFAELDAKRTVMSPVKVVEEKIVVKVRQGSNKRGCVSRTCLRTIFLLYKWHCDPYLSRSARQALRYR